MSFTYDGNCKTTQQGARSKTTSNLKENLLEACRTALGAVQSEVEWKYIDNALMPLKVVAQWDPGLVWRPNLLKFVSVLSV